jgi:alginate O-acetyltransferase complex protein AlgJ
VQILIMVAALVFFFGPALGWLLGVRPSEIDNRKLTAFPSLLEGGWKALPQVGQWASDNLPGRKQSVALNDKIDRTLYNQQPTYGSAGIYPQVILGKDGWLYYGGDVSNKCMPRLSVSQSITRMRSLQTAVTKSGRRFVLVVVPDKSSVYPAKLPDRYAGEQCATQRDKTFWRALSASGLGVDVRAPLEAAQRTYGQPMYRKYDSHFSPRGAVTYAQTLMNTVDPGLAKGTTVADKGPSQAPGDLGTFVGKRLSETVEGLQIKRTGVTMSADSQPKLATSVTHVHNISRGAALYRPPAILLGDSFTASSLPQVIPYFADLELLHSETSTAFPQAVANALIDRQTVIYEIVERSAATGYAGLLSTPSLTAIERTLAAHPYRR